MIVAHADWSIHPRGRRMAVACGVPGDWRVGPPEPVGNVGTLIDRLVRAANGNSILLGLDFPIGVPRDYASLHTKERDFPHFLRALGSRPSFFVVCGDVGEVSGERPFYPNHSRKGTIRSPHIKALGFQDFAQMTRLCDRKTADRPAAASMFWTLGPNQVGKAAISGWRDLLLPALLRPDPVHLWPFDGRLTDLVARGGLTIAETYPADAMRQIGLPRQGSKLRQADRAASAHHLEAVMAALGAVPDAALLAQVKDGFGADGNADDSFDALIGMLCMLQVMAGKRDEGTPNDHSILTWEGWVLGQSPC